MKIVRWHLSDSPLHELRKIVLFLLEIVTDLACLPSHLLEAGTPFSEMLQRGILDSLYSGSANRPSEYLLFIFDSY